MTRESGARTCRTNGGPVVDTKFREADTRVISHLRVDDPNFDVRRQSFLLSSSSSSAPCCRMHVNFQLSKNVLLLDCPFRKRT